MLSDCPCSAAVRNHSLSSTSSAPPDARVSRALPHRRHRRAYLPAKTEPGSTDTTAGIDAGTGFSQPPTSGSGLLSPWKPWGGRSGLRTSGTTPPREGNIVAGLVGTGETDIQAAPSRVRDVLVDLAKIKRCISDSGPCRGWYIIWLKPLDL
jgi:hypothetical protein